MRMDFPGAVSPEVPRIGLPGFLPCADHFLIPRAPLGICNMETVIVHTGLYEEFHHPCETTFT